MLTERSNFTFAFGCCHSAAAAAAADAASAAALLHSAASLLDEPGWLCSASALCAYLLLVLGGRLSVLQWAQLVLLYNTDTGSTNQSICKEAKEEERETVKPQQCDSKQSQSHI